MSTDWLDGLFDTRAAQTYAEVTISNLNGTYNALTATGLQDASSIAISTAAGQTSLINGIVAPSSEVDTVNSLVKLVRLPWGTFTTTLVHDSGSAAPGDKIITADGANITNQQGPGSTDVYVLLARQNGSWFATRLGARVLSFGTTVRPLSVTAPTANQLLAFGGSSIDGIDPGSVMSRMTAANHSTAAITFTANRRYTWNGSATPSLTASKTSAVDGATVVIYFPAASISSITLSTDIDPSGTLVYAFDDAAAAYELTMVWRAQGYVSSAFRKVQIVP